MADQQRAAAVAKIDQDGRVQAMSVSGGTALKITDAAVTAASVTGTSET
jgi:hypothetical protein